MPRPRDITWAGLSALVAVSIARCYFIVKDTNANYIRRKSSISTLCNQGGRLSRARRGSGQKWSMEKSRLADQQLVMPNLDSFMRFYYTFSLLFNIYYAIKHLVIILLDLEIFRHFRYLDCYLLGRLCLNVRVVGMANLYACFIASFNVLWALIVERGPGKFHMPFVQFLLHNKQEVSRWDAGCERHNGPSGNEQAEWRLSGDSLRPSSVYYSSLFHYFKPPRRLRSRKRLELFGRHDSQAPPTKREPPSQCLSPSELFKLRPNRSVECWRKLSEISNRFCMFFFALASTVNLAIWWMALPLLLFETGFELTYGHCVQYIAQQKAANNGTVDLWIDHKLIFDPPDAGLYRAPERPLHLISVLDDYAPVRFNWYHATRVVLCSFELLVFYTELCASFSSKASIVIIMIFDISNYSAEINRKLGQLIQDHRSLSIFRSGGGDGGAPTEGAKDYLKRAKLNQIEQAVRRDTSELQAMIGDMFELIYNYNRYASTQMSFLILLWLCYSALVSGWMFVPLHNLPKAEWYALHVFATLFLLLVMFAFGRVRRDCMRMHHKMSIAMALDEDYQCSKATWLALLRFYTPMSIYCFTIQRDEEMSMLFALKLLAWLFTALSVTASIWIFRSGPWATAKLEGRC